jgi:hypothetical protein
VIYEPACSSRANLLAVLINWYSEISGLTVACMKKTAFWDIAAFILVDVYRRFGDAYCVNRGDNGVSAHLCNVGILH